MTATLSGSPEELIDEIRVAAFRLVAPERLVGNIAILSDVPGANVMLDGVDVGKTPLAGPLVNLPMGVHKLAVEREGFSSFAEDVPVRFEKTTQVVVHQNAMNASRARSRAPPPRGRRDADLRQVVVLDGDGGVGDRHRHRRRLRRAQAAVIDCATAAARETARGAALVATLVGRRCTAARCRRAGR